MFRLAFLTVILVAAACGSITPALAQGGCAPQGCDAAACDLDDCGCDLGCGTSCFEDSCDCPPNGCVACGRSQDRCQCMGRMKLLGCLRPSDHCFDDFISPMINFVFFEDPRTLTELRPIFVNHNVPDALGGGSIQLYAAEIRLALTERLSLIATKDGYIVDHTGAPLDNLLADGWADLNLGLKYNVLRDARSGTLASIGFTYELPIGSTRALQAVGDGEFHLFGSAGQRFLDGNAHWLTAFGWRVPVDGAVQTESIHWSNHFDVRVTDTVYVFTEFAWWHWIDSADAGLNLGVGGQDLFNLPVTNVDDNDLVTQNVGLRYKPCSQVVVGAAFEFPLTEFQDVIDDRFVMDMILRY